MNARPTSGRGNEIDASLGPMPPSRRSSSAARALVGLSALAVLAPSTTRGQEGLAVGIQAFLVKPFRIPSVSMVPTLEVGQRVLVNRIGTHFGDPERGDVVVFKPPAGANDDRCGIPSEPADGHPCEKPTEDQSKDNFIKRVIGLPGDTIAIKGNHAIVNGCRRQNRILVTHARHTMAHHFGEFLMSGRISPGVFIVSQHAPIGEVIDELVLIRAAPDAAEWMNRIADIPQS